MSRPAAAASLPLFTPAGRLVPSDWEVAEQEKARAEAERQRADAAEAELKRVRALLGER